MELAELIEQNRWWKDKSSINADYDIVRWNSKKHRWVPDIIRKITLEPFALHILSGPRQAGKTTAVKLLVKELLETRDPRSLFYFNCENVADYKELTGIIETYLQFREDNSLSSSVIILDEITLPKEWYRSIKGLIDRGALQHDVVLLTGSSSMSVRRYTELFPGRRGKGKDLVMYPLSFRSFLAVFDPETKRKIPALANIEMLEKEAARAVVYQKELDRNLKAYMEYGGFPLSIADLETKEETKRAYLSWIKNAVLKADRSDVLARQIVKVIVETAQTDVSWECIAKKIEIKSPKTVAAYVELLKSIFALNVLYNIDISGKKIRFGKNKKLHLRDPLLMEIFEDWCLVKAKDKPSALAEAVVIEHLERFFPEQVFFWKDGFEIDAIVNYKDKLYGFEVKWSEHAHAKGLNNLKKFFVITRKEYSQNHVPLSVFLSLLDV